MKKITNRCSKCGAYEEGAEEGWICLPCRKDPYKRSLPTIPFLPEFEKDIESKNKTATSRTKKYGKPGDHFKAFSMLMELTHVVRVPLFVVAKYFYREEGCKSPDEFKKVWNKIHPRKKYEDDPGRMVSLHLWR